MSKITRTKQVSITEETATYNGWNLIFSISVPNGEGSKSVNVTGSKQEGEIYKSFYASQQSSPSIMNFNFNPAENDTDLIDAIMVEFNEILA